MGFSKAAPQQARLKVAVYGPPGSGKTFTTLLVAEGLAKAEGKRIAFVDTERGTDFYAMNVKEREVHPEAFDFDALYSQSLADVSAAVYALDPKVYGVVVLDSISHLWDAAIAAYTGKKTSADTIPINAWGSIKKPYKGLVKFLLDSPFHVFILGRQKSLFETDNNGEMKKMGVTMRAEGETPYEPHLCIRMDIVRGDKSGKVYAYVEKDRTGILSLKIIPNPSFSTFTPILPLLGTVQAQSEDPDEVAAKDSDLLTSATVEKDKAKEAKSSEKYAYFNGAITGAKTLAELGIIAGDLKKNSRYMNETHLAGLRVLYEERRKVLSEAAAPEGV